MYVCILLLNETILCVYFIAVIYYIRCIFIEWNNYSINIFLYVYM